MSCPCSGTHSPTTAIAQGSGFVAYCPKCKVYVSAHPTGYLKAHDAFPTKDKPGR